MDAPPAAPPQTFDASYSAPVGASTSCDAGFPPDAEPNGRPSRDGAPGFASGAGGERHGHRRRAQNCGMESWMLSLGSSGCSAGSASTRMLKNENASPTPAFWIQRGTSSPVQAAPVA